MATNTPALDAYIGRINLMRDFARKKNPKIKDMTMPTNEESAKELIARLEQDISPENLTCDGELPPREVQSRLNHIMGCVRELSVILGRKVELVY